MENSTNITNKKLADISVDLEEQSKKMVRNGAIAIFGALVFAIFFFIFMYGMTVKIFHDIDVMHTNILNKNAEHKFDDLTSLVFFLAVRTVVFGLVGFFIIFFILKIARSCFDQSARFTKRKHATEFLDYISDKEDGLEAKMKAFYVWNMTVESAFTQKEKNNSKIFSLGKVFGAEANNENITAKAEV